MRWIIIHLIINLISNNVVWHKTPITAVRRMLSKNSTVRLFLHFCQSNKSILAAHYLLLFRYLSGRARLRQKQRYCACIKVVTVVYLTDEEDVPRQLKRKTGHIP